MKYRSYIAVGHIYEVLNDDYSIFGKSAEENFETVTSKKVVVW